ncbi:MAG: nucleoside-diphosphate sugar epimerase/dehydratase, partial [Alphaproteobacteria bacterium]
MSVLLEGDPIPVMRLQRIHIAYGHDISMAAASVFASLYLRLGNDLFYAYSADFILRNIVIFTLVAAAVFWPFGLYRGVWRYASMNDLLQIVKAVTLVVLISALVLFIATRGEGVPRSLPVINWFVLIALLGAPRFLYRLFKDRRIDLTFERGDRPRVPVLLVGAGDAAETFIRAMTRADHANYRVVGVLDEKGNRVGRKIHDVPVLGDLGDVDAVVRALARRGDMARRLIVTKEDLGGERIRFLLDRAENLGITMSRLPRLTDFRNGSDAPIEMRPIAVEDILGRPQAVLDRPAMRALVAGRRILVTGAGGTIGSELVRQISDLAPAYLALVDSAEFNLYSIDMELAERQPELPRSANLADVRERARMDEIMVAERPELVFHAAALKHVPMVESHPCEGVLTNVTGTRNVADACRRQSVAAMVLISTDKAVNPTSVMGASKRVAESYCQALDIAEGVCDGASTRFVTVRFGNVLGSTGSVVPLFQRQIAEGGPVTVTDPMARRYFMSVREAVELVLQATALRARQAGGIFVLEMGEPVRILDLARQMIRLSGKEPEREVEIVFIGLRPGEKLHEELFHDAEAIAPTAAPGIVLAAPR